MTSALAISLWIVVGLFQAQGTVAVGWGSEEACKEFRQEWMDEDGILAISDCVETKVAPVEKKL